MDVPSEFSPFSCRPSRRDLPGTRDHSGLSRGHRTPALSQLSLQELSSVGVLACHKFVEKSLIALQTEPLLASKIPVLATCGIRRPELAWENTLSLLLLLADFSAELYN